MHLPAILTRMAAISVILSTIAISACSFGGATAPPAAPVDNPPLTNTVAPEASATVTAAPAPTVTSTAAPSPAPARTPAAPAPAAGFPAEVVRGDATKPLVALTFDSGSVAGDTGKILDILARNQVKTSWFITGQFAEQNTALVKRVAQEGHEVFNHSYSHPDLTTLGNEQIVAELNKAEGILKGITGKAPRPYMRMPFGARNSRVLQVVGDMGYRSIYWTLDSADWREGWTAQMVQDRVLSNTGNGYIVVHHSSPAATSGALDNEIKTLKQRGFQLVTISTLLGQQGGSSYRTAAPDEAPDGDDLLVLVNKRTRLPDDYAPADLHDLTAAGIPTLYRGMQLRAVAVPSLTRLFAAAKADGIDMKVLSSYRSYREQEVVFQREVAAQGLAQAERVSAHPGHSQHQLGTTVDFTAKSVNMDLSESFADTPEGMWLAVNAHRFGFVMSYPRGQENVTGYSFEPWHFRYVGEQAAADLMRRGIILEEYLAARH